MTNATTVRSFSTSQAIGPKSPKAQKRTPEEVATQKKVVEKSMQPAKPAVDKLAKVITEQNSLPSINTFRMLSVISGKRVQAGQDIEDAVAAVMAQYQDLILAALNSQKDVPTIPQLDVWFAAQYPANVKPIKTVKSEEPAVN